MPEVTWPESPTHTEYQAETFGTPKWLPARIDNDGPYGYTFRTCSYCGCIHPEDLVNAIAAGATLGGSDWKFGYPHKFYVQGIPNPKAGQDYPIYTTTGRLTESMRAEGGWEEFQDGFERSTGAPTMRWRKLHQIMKCSPDAPAKFYSDHLRELSAEAFAVIAPLIERHAKIRFEQHENGLKYHAPYHGYQK